MVTVIISVFIIITIILMLVVIVVFLVVVRRRRRLTGPSRRTRRYRRSAGTSGVPAPPPGYDDVPYVIYGAPNGGPEGERQLRVIGLEDDNASQVCVENRILSRY